MNIQVEQDASSDFCDRINLADFNQIQPHGCILVLDKNLNILQYSENIESQLETPLQEILNNPLLNYLKAVQDNTDLSFWLQHTNNQYKRLYWQAPEKKLQIWASIHPSAEHLILEIERTADNSEEMSALFDLTQSVISSMQENTERDSIEQLVKITCEEIKRITRYDRINVYQFDPKDHSGLVIGEALNKGMDSYLGLHFPATDVPQSVREMYLNLSLRYIPTILENSVKVVSVKLPGFSQIADISVTNLRMVAPIHIKYLKNMQVAAATSIAIIHDKNLWGLITCHSNQPKPLSMNCRLILTLMANTLATQISSLEYSRYLEQKKRIIELQSLLATQINKEDSIYYALNAHHLKLLEFVSATGMSVYFQGSIINYGETPTSEEMLRLITWLQMSKMDGAYATSTLPLEFPESINYKDKACGLLAIRIMAFENHFLLFYKPERVKTVTWAGNPHSAVRCEEASYSPRDSFAKFIESITNHAEPWTKSEIKSGEFIRTVIVNKQLQDLLQIQAMHDPLTDLLNRQYLDQRLTFEIMRATRESTPLALILMDLDFFKKINDVYGHQAGDYVLTSFAKFLKNHFRGYDYIYRYGGEEFLLLLPGVDHSEVLRKMDILRTELKELNLEYDGKRLPSITVSAGISSFPQNGNDAKNLIELADQALYRAKSNGRNRTEEAHA